MKSLKGVLSYTGSIGQLLLLVGFMLVFSTLGISVLLAFTGSAVNTTESLRTMQLFQSLAMFVFPPLLLAYLCYQQPLSFLSLKQKTNWSIYAWVILLILVALPGINLLADWNKHLQLPSYFSEVEQWMMKSESETQAVVTKMLTVTSVGGLLINLLIVAVTPAVGEELFFRGALLGIMKKNGKAVLAIWISALVFSAFHMQFYGFVPRMLLGALFGYLAYWTNDLRPAMLAHFINNATTVLFFYLKTNGYRCIDLENIGSGETQSLGWFSLAATMALIFFLRGKNRSNPITNGVRSQS